MSNYCLFLNTASEFRFRGFFVVIGGVRGSGYELCRFKV